MIHARPVALLAEFRHHYSDPDIYRSTRYRTQDHVIPFRTFWLLYREIGPHRAGERLNLMRAVNNALQRAFGKNTEMPESVRADLKEARLLPSES